MIDTRIGETTLVINSSAAASDLFDKRSAIYSSRPPNPFIFDLLSDSCAATHLPFGSRFRKYRKIMGHALKPMVLQEQKKGVHHEVMAFLERLSKGTTTSWCEQNQVLAASLGSIIVSAHQHCRPFVS